MAALATSLIPVVIPLVAKLMDKIFGSGSGPKKLSTGTEVLQALLTQLGSPTSPQDASKALQDAVDTLNSKGELQGHSTKIDPIASPMTIGSILKILDGTSELLRSSQQMQQG